MKNKNEQGFALVLSLVLMLAMSLMGGALIVISAGDHQSNNASDDYQQTFYVAETALIEGEKYLLNQFLGPWDTGTHARDVTNRNLPNNGTTVWNGDMLAANKINYDASTLTSKQYLDTKINLSGINDDRDPTIFFKTPAFLGNEPWIDQMTK